MSTVRMWRQDLLFLLSGVQECLRAEPEKVCRSGLVRVLCLSPGFESAVAQAKQPRWQSVAQLRFGVK